ncbi:hypothetical protein HanRHA438_Chr09g0420731 [Helianthus annuus]|nr:hypothetical protein HanRHA438_Chr09g0420731 [Helianthus annuus]
MKYATLIKNIHFLHDKNITNIHKCDVRCEPSRLLKMHNCNTITQDVNIGRFFMLLQRDGQFRHKGYNNNSRRQIITNNIF